MEPTLSASYFRSLLRSLAAGTLALTAAPLGAAMPAFERWGGPAAVGVGNNGSRYSTSVTLGNGDVRGRHGTLEFMAGGAVLHREEFAIPPGGTLRRQAPPSLAGQGPFLVRAVADGKVSLYTETRSGSDGGATGFSASGFAPWETLSAGDVAEFRGASASASPLSSRGNMGLLCLPDLPCEVEVIVLGDDGTELGQGRLAAGVNGASQVSIATLVPAAAGRELLSVRVIGLAGRARPFVVVNDNRTNDGALLSYTVDRTMGSTFAFPIGCQLGRDCWISNYQDRDPGPGASDYASGHVTYDRHDGVDILINGFAAMDLGVDVLAAAAGVVAVAEDGHEDRCTGDCTTLANQIGILHPDGTLSAYVHLKRGSLLVSPGDVVSRGQKIAEVGSSGNSTDPHLHFAWLRPNPLRIVDPFTTPGDNLVTPWEEPASYQDFSGTSVARVVLAEGEPASQNWSVDPPPLTSATLGQTIWVRLCAIRLSAGTAYAVTLRDPNGSVVVRNEFALDEEQPYFAGAIPFTIEGGPVGDWSVEVEEAGRRLTRRRILVGVPGQAARR